jgi:PAS domain S-box-containing protein
MDSKFKILVNQLPLGVYRTDVNGNFIFVNPFLAKLLEFNSVEELYKINVSDIFVDIDDRTKQLERWKRSIINSEEVELRTKTGRHIFVRDIGLSILNKLGNIEYFDGIIEDITDSVVMKEELTRARDRALESDRLKTTFLTNMSHEIRTPMNSILGFSSMLKRKGIHHHKREQYLDIIISRGQHLMQILNDILDITRIEEDQIQKNSSLFNLNLLLEDLYQCVSLELKASQKNIVLTLATPLPEEDTLITTDSQHLSKIFTNLLNNSVKFTEEGTIEFGYILDKEKNLVFFVKDTGIGIPPELYETVFHRFRQADESFTRVHGGLGLGLAICKGLTKLLGGKIWLESDGHSGSTFYFTIADSRHINEDYKIEHTTSTGSSLFWENKHVLIVEDDPASFEYLNEILTLTGCIVMHATNGREAMDIYSNTYPIDLILLDIQLPEIDGYQLAQNIRAHNPSIPIIAQTAHALSEDKRKCIEAGCSSYITKPISYDMLIDTLKEFLG